MMFHSQVNYLKHAACRLLEISLWKFIPSPKRNREHFTRQEVLMSQMNSNIILLKEAVGRVESRQQELELSLAESGGQKNHDWTKLGFRAFSQSNEDGLLDFVLRRVQPSNQYFIEIGVEDYTEANTRFLLGCGGWRGCIVEADRDSVDAIKSKGLYYRQDLTVIHSMVDCENIDAILKDAGVPTNAGLLSLDIDGNDIWVWQAMQIVKPLVAVIEYNWRFGPDLNVAVPYDPKFDRREADPSWLYYGSSLTALVEVSRIKGYDFVGCSSNGANAVFVRSDCRPANIGRITPSQGYRMGVHSEFRELHGRQSRKSPQEEIDYVHGLSLPLIRDL